jgi:uncharacterized protein (TIGR03000 family)
MRGRRQVLALILFVGGVLLLGPAVSAGEPPRGGWPWQRRPAIHGYDDRPPTTAPPAEVKRAPVKYTITITVYPQMAQAAPEMQNIAVVMAYLPEHALVWFDGEPTQQSGVLREYQTPPLRPAKKYTYQVRLLWFEDGHWVKETKDVPVMAGQMTCLYLAKPAAIAAALARLPAEDRKRAEQQRFCAVQPDNPLGALGPPVKVTIKGQPVFLCCKDCAEQARKDPDKTLASLKELKAKNARTPAK